jgi:hypothetical protein
MSQLSAARESHYDRCMRSLFGLAILAACGGNDVDPRVIPGGGIGDGAIEGEVNVHVIDEDDEVVDGATVRVGGAEAETDENGLAVFADVDGPQTITVAASGFRTVVWAGANGANVTIPLTRSNPPAPDSAQLAGSIPGWDDVKAGQLAGHIRAAVVFYSHTDDLGDDANNLQTAGGGNLCGVVGTTCDWTLTSRIGTLTVIAAFIDRDTKNTPVETDDTNEIIGWASLSDVRVQDGVNQSGLMLVPIEAGNLEDLTIELGTPPAGLPEAAAFVGIEVSEDEVIQLPLFLQSEQTVLLAPKPAAFATGATYRLTAVAQTTSGEAGAQSIVIRRALRFSFDRVEGAKVHQVAYDTATDTVLEVTLFDTTNTFDLPSLVELPSGALTARVSGIGATLDVNNFSLEEDGDLLFGVAVEPTPVP